MRHRANRLNKPGHGARSLLGAGLIAFTLLAFLATPAFAVETHAFTGVTIGPEGKTASGEFTDLQSVAVDPSTGDLYVLDVANGGRLYKFNGNGEPLNFTATGKNFIEGVGGFPSGVFNQVAIVPSGSAEETAGDIYVANSEQVKIYSSLGGEITHITSTFEDICGVAVDETGNVFTQSEVVPIVREYSPTIPPTEIDHSAIPIEETCNLAVDGKGHIYAAGTKTMPVGGTARQKLWRLPSLTAETKELFDPRSSTVAVEPTTEDVYVSHGTEVVQYAAGGSGSIIAKFGEDRLVQAPGLAVGGAGGDVYVSNRGELHSTPPTYPGRVDVFGPLVTLPTVVAGAAPKEDITKTRAVLRGTIDADGGPPATCEFQYIPQAAFEIEGFEGATGAPCEPAGPFNGESAEAVSAAVTGLSVGSKYFFRLVGQNEHGRLGSDENGSAPGKVSSFETLPAFGVQTGSVTNLTATLATLTGSINPEGVSVSECFFEYGETSAYGNSIPCETAGGGEIGSGNAPVAVHAAVAGLTGSTRYHFQLVGGSSEFGGVHVDGGDAEFGTQGPPEIVSQSVSGIGQTSATISGSINPHSSPTTYFVEYVTEAAFRESEYATATKVPVGGVPIGSGFTEVAVRQALIGLVPGTRYRVRLYAENALGHDLGSPDDIFATHAQNPWFPPCPANEVFRVEWSAALPDCRAYEQASSPNKNGGSVAGLYSFMFSSEDGSAVTFYSAAGSLPPGERGGAQTYSTYLAKRDASAGSWSSQRLLPPQEFGEFAEFLGATPDLRYAVVEAGTPAGNLQHKTGLFVVDTEDGAVTQITPYELAGEQVNIFGFDGASADGSRIFFESTATISTTPKVPAPVAGHDNLYMWERSTGDVSLVGVLPVSEGKEEAPPAGSFGGAYEWYEHELPSTGGALNKPGNAAEPVAVAGLHAISPSGEQIFFTAAGSGQLYLRRGLGGADPMTVRISTPNAGVSSPSGEFPAAFLEATPDGSRAFLMSREHLTANAASGEHAGERDLYRWDASAPMGQGLTDIAPEAEVQGLLGVNSTGTVGYFVARGVLANKNPNGENPEAGGENLYRFAEKTSGGFRITFITTLAEGSGQSPDRRNVSPKVSRNFPVGKTSRLSEDGETLLFASGKSLTGYDNFNLEGISCEGGPCPELYLYSAQSGEITCVSCNPTGEVPVGAASLQDQFFNAYFTPSTSPAVSPSRNLSADGTRVFFQTPDPLVAADKNGNVSCPAFGGSGKQDLVGPGLCQDVYEWEAVGSGSCQYEEANGGCLYLLSTGQSEQPSYFVGASKDGSSAFIATNSQLVPADQDQADDVYDVREGGGLASQHERAPVPCGAAAACKGSGSVSPPGTSPATSSFQGPGNPKPPRCKKGYVAKKGKCVKKPKKQQQNKGKKQKTKKHYKAKRATGKRRSGGAK
jgi:hypothetical protein